MNKRLIQLLNSAKIGGGTCLLDTYNQAIYTDIAPTITTRVNASNSIYIMKVRQLGNITSKSFKNPQTGREPKIMENTDKTICLNSKVEG